MFPLCLGPARNSTILVIFSPPIFPLENSVRLASLGFPFSNHRNTGRGLDSPAKQRQTKHYITTVRSGLRYIELTYFFFVRNTTLFSFNAVHSQVGNFSPPIINFSTAKFSSKFPIHVNVYFRVL